MPQNPPAPVRTLEERVNYARQQLALMHAACLAVASLIVQFDDDDILFAVAERACDAADVLGPLAHAPAAVANWEPSDPEPDATEPAVLATSPRSGRHGLRALPPQDLKPDAASSEGAS